jgi:centractin
MLRHTHARASRIISFSFHSLSRFSSAVFRLCLSVCVFRLCFVCRCYVAYNAESHDRDESEELEPEVPYKLPDGSVLQLSSEKYRAPELLFNPSLIGSEEYGIQHCALHAIARSDMDVRRSLFTSIILSGGSTLFDGFGDRLLSEMRRLAARDTKIKIWAAPERVMSSWIGGSILASLASFKHMWITRKQYEEVGKNIIHRRTF